MNILYVIHDNKRGGAAKSFLEMISIIQKKHNVLVITPHKKGYVPKQLDKMGVRHFAAHYYWWEISVPSARVIATIKMLTYRVLNLWNYIEAFRIGKKLKIEKIDIIHSNSSVINFGALLSKELKKPHIWHLREYGEEDFGLKKVVSDHTFQKEMNVLAVNYVAISQSIKNKYADIVDEDKICHIYNGVADEYQYKKDFSNFMNKKVKFLISGNYCREKGQVDAINAAIDLYKQGIKDFVLYLAGNGDFGEPRRLVKEYQIDENVVFCGSVDNMLQLRKEVDIEIVASKCEAFGRVTIEAMRMSNPVIGTNTGGTPELIRDGYNGFLFEYGNHIQLAELMKKYICDVEMIARMGGNAYLSVKDRFTPHENANYILNLYDEIVMREKN